MAKENSTEATSLLIFRLRQSRYAVEADAVREIVPLPEVVPLDETPAYVIGVANLHGRIVPIIDLNLRFGHTPQPYRLEDCVVVLEQAASVVGIVVNEVQTVLDVSPEERLAMPSYGRDGDLDTRFLAGLVQSREQIVMVIDLENLLRLSEGLSGLPAAAEMPSVEASVAFLAAADESERTVFRERALQLAEPLKSQQQDGSTPLVVVRLGEEFFGIALQAIREFAELRSVTPIPCCPQHVVGLMNLRGDLITVLDVGTSLGVLPAEVRPDRKVVVLNRLDWGVGVLVDDVLDVLTLPTTAVTPALTTPSDRQHLLGAVPYGTQMLRLLDLPTLLMQQNFTVNESP